MLKCFLKIGNFFWLFNILAVLMKEVLHEMYKELTLMRRWASAKIMASLNDKTVLEIIV